MKNINKMATVFISAANTLALTGCYKDYVEDFDYSGAYLAYQYDLRTFVVGEGMQFKIGAVIGGVMTNEYDRDILPMICGSMFRMLRLHSTHSLR